MSSSPRLERDAYLLGGRRVRLSDLLDAGLLEPETPLVFERRRLGALYKATIRADGRIQLADGRTFSSPSRAAVAAAGGSLDGWHAWQVAGNGEYLDTLRQRLLDNAAQADDGTHGQDGTVSGTSRHDALKDARRKASEGCAVQIAVRELLSMWGASGRGSVISDRISAELDNHGLTTKPNFLKVGLDSIVALELQTVDRDPVAASEGLVAYGTDQRLNDSGVTQETNLSTEGSGILLDDVAPIHDVGITLGNLPSANIEVEAVSPQASFEEAITKMLLNDFSQLAVMTGPRSLNGAVTWQSIARERHANDDATLSQAIVMADVLPFDTELIDVLPTLQAKDFVFVKDSTSVVTGIVTTADVVRAYGQLATPFFLIGELDQLLRRVISENFALDSVARLCDEDDVRGLTSYDDLTIGDYERVLQNREKWAQLQWPLDRSIFIARLTELRGARNDVMHFNPDPVPEGVVAQIRNMIRLIRKYV